MGIMTNLHFKSITTSLKFFSQVSEVDFILERVVALTLLDANKNLNKIPLSIIEKGEKNCILGHASPTHSQS